MRILHIGDFHYKSKGVNYEQGLMINKMIETLKSKPKIDIILFSGDLVYSGSKYESFELAHEKLFANLISELKVDSKNIFICQGNHDIKRDDCSTAVINYFDEKILDNDKLNKEITTNSSDFNLSIKPSENYFKYFQKYFKHDNDIENVLYSIHKRIIDTKEISIVTLNSSWLSCGLRSDNNLLMLPTSVLKEAIDHIKESHCKILLIHHPLTYFKEFNSIELEDLIHKEFNLMFNGHIHREKISTNFAGNNGIYSNTTQATLTFDKDGEIGFSLIEYNFDEPSEIIIERSSYSKKEHYFKELSPVHVHVPYGQEKAKQNKIRKKITSKFNDELVNANELLLEYNEESSPNFLDLFTYPILTTKSEADSSKGESNTQFNYETLYSSKHNYLIFGKDKCGKTSLLKQLQLHFLKNFSIHGKTPLYLDYKDLETKSSQIDIKRALRLYYEIFIADVDTIISEGKLLLLIDNLNTKSPINDTIISFLEANKNVQFIICSDYLASRVYFEDLDHLDYQKIYFKDLSRKEIRLYTEKHPEIKKLEHEEVIERITVMCQQMQLPVNYWTISLILLIYKKSNEDYNKNLFGILDLCVDEILKKKQLILVKSKLSFEQYKELCSRIAHFLLIEHKKNVYSCTYIQLVSFIETLLKENIRLVGDPKEILDYLLETGIIKEKEDKYTFRLNGIFEYFLAYYIYQHPDFKDEILNDDSIYLTFKNELEIYSGFNRKDEDFLNKVYLKTKNVFDKLITRYSEYGQLDEVLMHKLEIAREVADFIKDLKVTKALSHEVQDAAKDIFSPLETESEVHLKEFIDSKNLNAEVLEKYLNILARVFKNSDNVTNSKLINEIFSHLIIAYANFGFFMIDEFSSLPKNEKGEYILSDEKGEIAIGEEILRLVSNFIPLLTQVLLYDGIGHRNLVKLIENNIEVYKQNPKQNQYKLFLLYFLLLDIDHKAYKKNIDVIFDLINLPPLKVSTYFKMNYYLAFKAYQNKELENFYKNKVQEAKLRIDNKTDSRNLNQFLSRKQKSNIARKKRSN